MSQKSFAGLPDHLQPSNLPGKPRPLLRTPDGIPQGWYVTVESGVPVLWKWRPFDSVMSTPERYRDA